MIQKITCASITVGLLSDQRIRNSVAKAIENIICNILASSRRQLVRAQCRKQPAKKLKKRGERNLPLDALFFIFSRTVFCTLLTERLEEASKF